MFCVCVSMCIITFHHMLQMTPYKPSHIHLPQTKVFFLHSDTFLFCLHNSLIHEKMCIFLNRSKFRELLADSLFPFLLPRIYTHHTMLCYHLIPITSDISDVACTFLPLWTHSQSYFFLLSKHDLFFVYVIRKRSKNIHERWWCKRVRVGGSWRKISRSFSLSVLW